MGLPAARVTDFAGHAGAIFLGSATVLIGGQPAARKGDPFVCMAFTGTVPHVMGNIVMGSATVMIGGSNAARMGDITGCNVAGVSGVGMPPVVTPGIPGSFDSGTLQVVGGPDLALLQGQHSGYKNKDGQEDKYSGSGAHLNQKVKIGDTTITSSHDLYTGTMEEHKNKYGRGTSGGGSVYKNQTQITSEDGSAGMGTSTSTANANLGYDAQFGPGPEKSGFYVGAAAQASLVDSEAYVNDTYKLPFGYDFKFKLTGGGSYGSVGGAGGYGVYKNHRDDRYHGVGMLDVEFLLGMKLGVDYSIGKSSSSGGSTGIGAASIPGTVITGLPTVLIG